MLAQAAGFRGLDLPPTHTYSHFPVFFPLQGEKGSRGEKVSLKGLGPPLFGNGLLESRSLIIAAQAGGWVGSPCHSQASRFQEQLWAPHSLHVGDDGAGSSHDLRSPENSRVSTLVDSCEAGSEDESKRKEA